MRIDGSPWARRSRSWRCSGSGRGAGPGPRPPILTTGTVRRRTAPHRTGPAQAQAWGPGLPLSAQNQPVEGIDWWAGDPDATAYADAIALALDGWPETPPDRLAYFATCADNGLELHSWVASVRNFAWMGSGTWAQVMIIPQVTVNGGVVPVGSTYAESFWLDESGVSYLGSSLTYPDTTWSTLGSPADDGEQ